MRYSIVFFAFAAFMAAFSSASVESGLRLDAHWNDVSLLDGSTNLGEWTPCGDAVSPPRGPRWRRSSQIQRLARS